MATTIEKLENLRADLESWFRLSGYLQGLIWRTTTQLRYSGDPHSVESHFATLIYVDSSFRNIVSGLPTAEPMHSQWIEQFEKFDGILSKHGFWFERINDFSLNVFENE